MQRFEKCVEPDSCINQLNCVNRSGHYIRLTLSKKTIPKSILNRLFANYNTQNKIYLHITRAMAQAMYKLSGCLFLKDSNVLLKVKTEILDNL